MGRVLRIVILACLIFVVCDVSAQVHDFNRSVRFVISEVSDNAKTLSWVQEANITGYSIRRRVSGLGSFSIVANLPGDAASFTDSNVEKGISYEYEVRKTITVSGSSITSPGYLFGGNEIPPIHFRGHYLILAETNAYTALESKLLRLKKDLEMDGWVVIIRTTESNAPVPSVKDIIRQVHQNTGGKLSTVLLFGRVPVPYSGVIRPDGHPDHEGAWPADVYYADIDGNWTDNIINSTVADNSRHHNIPGDGKFDQSILPSDVELEVGRVDFFDLPAFSKSEFQLLEDYLDKNHEFRNGRIIMPRRGIIQNNFPSFEEAFGQTALNNFTRFFGIDSVRYGEYRNTLRNNPYLWSYGCGGGSYTSASGITNTTNFAVDSLQTIFTALFGSYFGDWDSRNNLLRAALASGTTLTNVWAGRPHWYFHHMAMGRHIGFSTKITQNNSFYPTGFGGRMIHVALMGDPGLTMYPYSAIDDISVSVDKNAITVDVISDHNEGFYFYLKQDQEEEYALINENPHMEKSFELNCIDKGIYQIMVRAVKREENASGNFMNLSIGKSAVFSVDTESTPLVDFDFQLDFDLLSASAQIDNANSFLWQLRGTGITDINADQLTVLLDDLTIEQLCIIATNDCGDKIHCKDLPPVISSLPQSIDFDFQIPSCHGYEDGWVSLILTGGAGPFEVVWSNGVEGFIIEGIGAGQYQASITSRTGKSEVIIFALEQPLQLEADIDISYNSDQSENMVSINMMGGTPPYKAIWSDGYEGLTRTDADPGTYIVLVSDANGCVLNIMINILPSNVREQDDNLPQFQIQVLQQNRLLIVFSESILTPSKARVYGFDGKLIFTESIPALTTEFSLNSETWPSGLYLLELESQRRQTIKKFFKP